ncbi:hypothetical protein Tco_1002720 [Tanacetum coccineum]|uniref:Uncharacterized protein n=1 Tax=Tanacetum coccineum TaxID=301880 RepID=A0ABQ5F8X4_9ASTR
MLWIDLLGIGQSPLREVIRLSTAETKRIPCRLWDVAGSIRHEMLPTLPSTPTPSPAELSGEPIMRGYRREAYHGITGTPPVPQEEDEREPLFIQAHDPNYVPEPIYPEYIPLEDDHEFPAEEQPLPPIDSPTAESPGYITESDPEEDPEGYEDDETEDGPREDEEDEEEEEHFAPADSTTVIPADESVYPSDPDFHFLSHSRAAEVERLLAMTTPSPSPPISLSPPSTGERLARLAFPPRLSLIAGTAAFPHLHYRHYTISNPLPAPVGPGQGIDYGFVSTVDAEERRQGIRDVGYGIRDTWVDPAEAVPEIAPMTVGEVNTRVIELTELHERDTHDLYALLEDA